MVNRINYYMDTNDRILNDGPIYELTLRSDKRLVLRILSVRHVYFLSLTDKY